MLEAAIGISTTAPALSSANRRAAQSAGAPLPDFKKILGSITRCHISLQLPNMGGKCDGQ